MVTAIAYAYMKKLTKKTKESARSVHTEHYTLILYIAGTANQSRQALENIKSICERHLKGCYTLQVIDIYQQPLLARSQQIIATPTLIKESPAPIKRLIGNMENRERVLAALNLSVDN